MNHSKKALSFALGMSLLGMAAASLPASAEGTDLFQLSEVSSNQLIACEGKCGSKSGGDQKCGSKDGEHKCGSEKCSSKDGEHKCGSDKGDAKDGEHKCGAGSCGSKSGEQQCGAKN